MFKFKKLPFFISTLLIGIGAQAHQALAGGTVEVTSLLGYSTKNTACELTEAVEAIRQEANVDGCRYTNLAGKARTITFSPELFREGSLPKAIGIVFTLDFSGIESVRIEGPGADYLVLKGTSKSTGPMMLFLPDATHNASYDGTLQNLSIEYTGTGSRTCIETKESAQNPFTLFVQNVQISGCTDSAIVSAGKLVVSNSVFRKNTALDAGQYGGAVRARGATEIDASFFSQNTAGLGGALEIWKADHLSITNSQFSENWALHGGALSLVETPEINLTNTTLWANRAVINGGAIYWGAGGYAGSTTGSSELNLTHITSVDNLAGRDVFGTFSTLAGQGKGGAIYSIEASGSFFVVETLNVTNSLFFNNTTDTTRAIVPNDLHLNPKTTLNAQFSSIWADGGAKYATDFRNLKGIHPDLVMTQRFGRSLLGGASQPLPGDPYFTVFVPKWSSPLIDRAKTLTPPLGLDELGEPRASAGEGDSPDIGAVEFQAGPGRLEFSKDNYAVTENASFVGGRKAAIVQRVGGVNGRASVECWDVEDTGPNHAVNGTDYIATKQELVWEDGQSAPKPCLLFTLDDDKKEPTKTVTKVLKNPRWAALGRDKTSLQIRDDD